ncbi:sulfate/molybdate ABC transporter ATP-binding protein [Glycocaulis profundi]|nr:sulfate/molybdate ABC transporter ATP-binding protein [Glycocaulis profundi]
MDLSIDRVTKEFGDFSALHEVSLDIASGELIALLGPSGSGKTTLLRLIAGLEYPSSGRILFGGEDASRTRIQDRRVGFVFQHYALFRHMKVIDNVAFGLDVRPGRDRPGKSEIRDRARELLRLVQLDGLEDRFPSQLSGGQRQRVALARALAIEPSVLLLDEPFGALDAQVRKELRVWLRELHDATGHTTVFVTHDQEEALELADRVVVMSQGRIEQADTPARVYDSPASEFVYRFVGESSRLKAAIVQGAVRMGGMDLGSRVEGVQDGPADVYVRPHAVELCEAGAGFLTGKVDHVRRNGGRQIVSLSSPAGGLDAEASLAAQIVPGDAVGFRFARWSLYREGAPLEAAP